MKQQDEHFQNQKKIQFLLIGYVSKTETLNGYTCLLPKTKGQNGNFWYITAYSKVLKKVCILHLFNRVIKKKPQRRFIKINKEYRNCPTAKGAHEIIQFALQGMLPVKKPTFCIFSWSHGGEQSTRNGYTHRISISRYCCMETMLLCRMVSSLDSF